jgi:hypothetical protein
MGGNAKKNLRMFRELCGESALKNVCIATTNWSRVTQEEGDVRERELRESPNLFKPLLDAGARLVCHDKEGGGTPDKGAGVAEDEKRASLRKQQIIEVGGDVLIAHAKWIAGLLVVLLVLVLAYWHKD